MTKKLIATILIAATLLAAPMGNAAAQMPQFDAIGAKDVLVHNPANLQDVQQIGWLDKAAKGARASLPVRIGVGLLWPRKACSPSSQADIDAC